MKKTLIIILLLAPFLSACSVVGTAVDIVTIPVDLLTMQETEQDILVTHNTLINPQTTGDDK